ncbi:MAG: type II toxin-antitoxin system RelB/DinJ family antitoxin [Desulfobacula sp.]|nr:type II toxin-antitoxin system RelB/DinJ family antitoxin [Desulfobacula sp.]
MDADLKNNAESILSSLGLTASQAINVFYKQITFRNGLPFPVEIPQKKPMTANSSWHSFCGC